MYFWSATGTLTPLKNATSLGISRGPPSVLMPLSPLISGKPVDCSAMTPNPVAWWMRPVISAARVGEYSEVE